MDPLPSATIWIVICLCWLTATSSFLLYSQPCSLMLLSHYFLSLYFYLCPGILPLSILSTRWSPSLLQKCPKYSYCLLLIFPQQQTSSSYRAQIPMDFSSLLLCVFLALWKGIQWKQLTSTPHYARCTRLEEFTQEENWGGMCAGTLALVRVEAHLMSALRTASLRFPQELQLFSFCFFYLEIHMDPLIWRSKQLSWEILKTMRFCIHQHNYIKMLRYRPIIRGFNKVSVLCTGFFF